MKTVADRHRHAAYYNKHSDELLRSVNIDDLEWPWTPKIEVFSLFLRFRVAASGVFKGGARCDGSCSCSACTEPVCLTSCGVCVCVCATRLGDLFLSCDNDGMICTLAAAFCYPIVYTCVCLLDVLQHCVYQTKFLPEIFISLIITCRARG